MTKKELKNLIEDFEYYNGGYSRLCGTDLRAVNVKQYKTKVTADIIVTDCEDGYTQRYNNCEYPNKYLHL